VPEEVKEAVGEVEIQLVAEQAAVDPGLPAGGVQREDDVAEVPQAGGAGGRRAGGKAQDVGRAVLAAPLPVQDTDARVVGEEDGEFHVLEVESAEKARSPGS